VGHALTLGLVHQADVRSVAKVVGDFGVVWADNQCEIAHAMGEYGLHDSLDHGLAQDWQHCFGASPAQAAQACASSGSEDDTLHASHSHCAILLSQQIEEAIWVDRSFLPRGYDESSSHSDS
jgi:hypothetical protein